MAWGVFKKIPIYSIFYLLQGDDTSNRTYSPTCAQALPRICVDCTSDAEITRGNIEELAVWRWHLDCGISRVQGCWGEGRSC